MSSRNVLDIRKSSSSRAKARKKMKSMLPERGPRLKVRRRRQRVLMFCVCLFAAAGMVGGLGAATHLQTFAINSVSVSGAKLLPQDDVKSAVNANLDDTGFSLISRKNMFLYPRSAIENALEAEFPRIQEVSVARQSLVATALIVTVKEREPFATWCDGSNACFAMDKSGFIYANAGETPQTPYVFRGGLLPNTDTIGQTFLRGRIRETVTLLDSLKNAGFTPLGLTVESETDFSIPLQEGPVVRASFSMDDGTVIRNLQTALSVDGLRDIFPTLEYIDLRFGNRVYYK